MAVRTNGLSKLTPRDKSLRVLCGLVLIALYSNVLKIWFGSWATLVSDVALVVALASLINYRWNPRHLRCLTAVFVSALLLILLSGFELLNENITNHLYSLVEFRKTFFQLLMLFIAYAYFDVKGGDKEKVRLIKFVVWASIPLILYGIKQFFAFDSFDSRLYSLMDSASDTNRYGSTIRAISFFSGPFHFGMFCALIFAMCLYLKRKTSEKRFYLLAAISLVGVFCSYTRTNMACVLIVMAVFLVLSGTKEGSFAKLSGVRVVLSCLGIAVAGLLFFASPGYVDLGNDQLNSLINSILNASEDSRLNNRFTTWEEAITLIDMHPLLGNGIGSAGDTLSAHSVAANWVTPHNAFLKVAVEMGVFGILLFVIFLIATLILCLKNARNDSAALPLVVSVAVITLINMMLGSTLGTFPVMTLVFLLIGVACKSVENTLSVEGD